MKIASATEPTYTTSPVEPENDSYAYYCEPTILYGTARSVVFSPAREQSVHRCSILDRRRQPHGQVARPAAAQCRRSHNVGGKPPPAGSAESALR